MPVSRHVTAAARRLGLTLLHVRRGPRVPRCPVRTCVAPCGDGLLEVAGSCLPTRIGGRRVVRPAPGRAVVASRAKASSRIARPGRHRHDARAASRRSAPRRPARPAPSTSAGAAPPRSAPGVPRVRDRPGRGRRDRGPPRAAPRSSAVTSSARSTDSTTSAYRADRGRLVALQLPDQVPAQSQRQRTSACFARPPGRGSPRRR